MPFVNSETRTPQVPSKKPPAPTGFAHKEAVQRALAAATARCQSEPQGECPRIVAATFTGVSRNRVSVMKTTTDPKPHRVTVRFNTPDYARLRLVAEQHGMCLADAVRLLVRRAPANEQPARKTPSGPQMSDAEGAGSADF